MPLRRLAQACGVSHETVRRVGLELGLMEVSPARRQQAVALRSEGLSWLHIAERTGLSIRWVRELCASERMPTPSAPGPDEVR